MDASVLRNGSIRALLAAEVVSTTGAQMTWVALPWFVLTTSGSATEMSVVITAEAVGLAITSLLGVRLLNRLGARMTMLACDASRGPLMLVIPVLHWTGHLTVPLLVVVAFAIGALTGPYFSAQRIIVPELLGEDESVISRAMALFQGAQRITLLLGPPFAGVLIGLIGAPSVLLVDAATYVVAVTLLGLFVPSTDAAAVEDESRGLRAGLRWVRNDPLIRAWRLFLVVGDIAFQAIFIGLPVLVVARYDADPRMVGFLFAGWGVGAVVGNLVSYRLIERTDGLTWIARVALLQAAPLWVLAVDTSAALAVAATFASGLGNGLINPRLHAITTLRIPVHLRPSVISSLMSLHMIAMPVGILGAGPLLDAFGVAPVFAATAAIQTVVVLGVAGAALRARGSAPADPDEPHRGGLVGDADRPAAPVWEADPAAQEMWAASDEANVENRLAGVTSPGADGDQTEPLALRDDLTSAQRHSHRLARDRPGGSKGEREP